MKLLALLRSLQPPVAEDDAKAGMLEAFIQVYSSVAIVKVRHSLIISRSLLFLNVPVLFSGRLTRVVYAPLTS